MLNQKVLIYVLFFVKIMVKGVDIQEITRQRNELRQQIVNSLVDVTKLELLSDTYSNISFDLCSPKIDRSLLCEAVIMLIDGEFPTHMDEPCIDPLSQEAYFDCVTMDGIVLKLRTLPLENKFLVEMNDRVYKVFAVSKNVPRLLISSDHRNYVFTRNWLIEVNPSAEDIIRKNDELELRKMYSIALKLNIFKVQTKLATTNEKQGPAICHPIYNRGLLCRAINISFYGQTYQVKDASCELNSFNDLHYLCLMANGETLFLQRGHFKKHVYLKNYKNEVVYIVQSLEIHTYLINKFALDGEAAELRENLDLVKQLLETPDLEQSPAEASHAEPEANIQMPMPPVGGESTHRTSSDAEGK